MRLPLSKWIETKLALPDDVSARPGSVRLYPYQKGIADAISDPLIERVSVVKSARIGYTTLLVGALGNHVVNDPAPVLFVLPTEDDCRQFVVSNVEPTFAASAILDGVLSGDLKEKNRNTMLSRRFPGGSLKVVAAKAPRNLRGHNVRILVMDEIDGMEPTAEGSPIRLAEGRTTQFDDRKIIIGSTPVFEESSLVLAAYSKSDQRIFEVRCVECDDYSEIKWKDIHWPEGKPEDAAWCCPGCGCVIEEQHKPSMVAKGRWRATRPDVKGHAGFRINSLVSPLANAAWGKLAAEFVAAKDKPEELQTFVNLMLGEGWKEHGDALDDAALAAKAEPFSLDMLPEAVLAITAGVDVQRKDRLEVTFIGWAEDGTAYVLGHRVIWGAPTDDETWRELDEMLKQRFQHPFGGKLGIDAVACDSGDGETMADVYGFCFPRSRRRIFAIKGAPGKRPWIERSKQKVKGGWLMIVGVDGIKSALMNRLRRGNTIRFSNSLPASWFEQLASEQVVVRYTRGQPVRMFERIKGRQAEALDCTVYAMAVRDLVHVNWSAREEQLRNPTVVAPVVVRPRVIESEWLRR
jgi:phage terminase large subunit GpA-like protein